MRMRQTKIHLWEDNKPAGFDLTQAACGCPVTTKMLSKKESEVTCVNCTRIIAARTKHAA